MKVKINLFYGSSKWTRLHVLFRLFVLCKNYFVFFCELPLFSQPHNINDKINII